MGASNNSKQAMWVAVGQFFAYAIGIVSPMILSRYFDKGDYGTYKQVMYVYNTLITVFAFGLQKAYSYFIPRVSLGESKDVVKKITNIFLVLGASFSLILFFGAEIISTILKNQDLVLALRVFSPTPLFLLPVMGLDCIMASYKKTQFVAIYSILTKVFTLFCIVLPVMLFKGGYIQAIIGFDIASFISFLLAIYLRNIPTRGVTWEKTKVTYKEIFSYSIPLMIASLWIMIFHSVNQFFVSRFYGNEVFADFSNGFIDFPIIPMVVNSVATVLLPLFSELLVKDKMAIKTAWTSAMRKSIKITYPIAVFSIVFAGLIMTCFYGNQYESSGAFFIVKNFEGFFSIIPFYPIILALGKTKQYSTIHMIIAIAIIPLEYIVVILGMPAIMIGVIYEFCFFLKIVLQFTVVSKTIGMSFRDLIPIKSMLLITLISIVASCPSFFAYNSLSEINKFCLLLIAISIFVVVYYLLCWLFHISYRDIFSSVITNNKFNRLLRLIP